MGPRDRDELSAAEEEAADTAMRRLLARYGQPTAVPPPPDLAARVLARLPDEPPAAAAVVEQRKRRRGMVLGGIALSVLVVLLALGMWGVFGSSDGPANLLGGATSGLGRAVLVLVLAAKPLVHVVLSLGGPLLVFGALLMVGAAWVWWQLVRHTPVPYPLEAYRPIT